MPEPVVSAEEPKVGSRISSVEYLHPLPEKPYDQGHIDVGSGHELKYYLFGNPKGEPVMIHHGGPGAQSVFSWASLFDRERFNLVFYDQPGCGASIPNAATDGKLALRNNTTDILADAAEFIREDLGLGRVFSFGGSWGMTVGAKQAIKYPDTVEALIWRGIFRGTKEEIDYFQGNNNPDVGAAKLYPDTWRAFRAILGEAVKNGSILEKDQQDPVLAYWKIFDMEPGTPDMIAFQQKALIAWSNFEDDSSFLVPPQTESLSEAQIEKAIRVSRLETHYFVNECFHPEIMEGLQIIADAQIPVYTVHGRHDAVCPVEEAIKVTDALNQAGGIASLEITEAGHSLMCRGNYLALGRIIDRLPTMRGYQPHAPGPPSGQTAPEGPKVV